MKNLIKNIKNFRLVLEKSQNLFSKKHIFVVILCAIFSMSSTSIWCMKENLIEKKQTKNIFFAIEEGDLEAVKNIIELSPDKINVAASEEDCKICKNEAFITMTPIALACGKGSIEIVKYLVEKMEELKKYFNAPLLSGFIFGKTPLAIACEIGNVKVVEFLVEKMNKSGIDFNAPLTSGNNIGWTSLGIACFSGKVKVVEFLVEKMNKLGINFNATLMSGHSAGMTPLAIACRKDNVKVVEYLVKKEKENINKPVETENEFNGYTPLAIACETGNVKVVELLVEKMKELKIDFNTPLKSGKGIGMTPLAIACLAGKVKVVEFLVEKMNKLGIDFNAPLTSGINIGWTPIAIACNNGKVDVVKFLVEKMNKLGIDFNSQLTSGNSIGWMPIAIACNKGYVNVVEFLVKEFKKLEIDFNAPLKSGNNNGWTPLFIACFAGKVEVVKYFIEELRIDFNAPLKSGTVIGMTPLAIACDRGNVEVVKCLVEKMEALKIDFNAQLKSGNCVGCTPLGIACKDKRSVEVSKYLVEELYKLGIDFNAKLKFGSDAGLTPLDIAINYYNFEVASFIREYLKKIKSESDEKSLNSSKSIMKKPDLAKKLILENCENNKKDFVFKIFNLLDNNNDRIGLFVNGIKDAEGNTPLSLACRNSNWALVQELLKYSNADTINTFNNEKKSCLYYACEKIASNEIIEKLATIETVSPSNDNPELHPILITLKLYNANKDNTNGEILANIIHSLVARNVSLECLFNERMILDSLKGANQIKSLILLARDLDNTKEGFLKFLISIEEKPIKGFEKILSTLISRFIYRSFYEVKSKIKESILKTDLIAFLNEMKKARELGSKSELLKKLATKNGYSLIKEFNESKKLKLDFSVMCDDKCACCIQKPRGWDAELCMLECGHIFHKKCIDEWLVTSKNKDCPNCRAKIELLGNRK